MSQMGFVKLKGFACFRHFWHQVGHATPEYGPFEVGEPQSTKIWVFSHFPLCYFLVGG